MSVSVLCVCVFVVILCVMLQESTLFVCCVCASVRLALFCLCVWCL